MSLLFASLNQAARDHRAAVAAQQGSTYAPRVAVTPSRQNWINLGLVLLTGMVGGAALVIVLVAQQPAYSVPDLTNNTRNSVWETAVPATPVGAPDASPLASTRLPPARYTPTIPIASSPETTAAETSVPAPDTQYGIVINNTAVSETVAATTPPPAAPTFAPIVTAQAAAEPVQAVANAPVTVQQVKENVPQPVDAAIASQIATYVAPAAEKRAPSEPAKPTVTVAAAPKPQAKIDVLMARAPKVKPSLPAARQQRPAASAEEGAAAMARGDANAALIAFQSVLNRNPTDKAAQIGKAMALEQTGVTSVALAQWRLLANQYPDDALVMTSYARALSTVDAGTSRILLQQVLARAPQFAPALAAQEALDAKAGNLDAMQDGQQKAWSPNKTNPAHRLNLAIIADKRGEKAQALELYKQAQGAFANGGWKATMPMSWSAVQARVDYLTEYLAKLPPAAVPASAQ